MKNKNKKTNILIISSYDIPTKKYLDEQIKIVNNNIKKLSNL
jgi:hypothetical protein